MTRGKRVLFVSYGGGHITMVLPVIAALRRMAPDIDPRLMALTIGLPRAIAAGETPVSYRDFTHLVDTAAMTRHGEALLGGLAGADVPRDESVAYLGINQLDLVATHGAAGAAALYAAQGRRAFLPVRFMTDVLREMRPDMVVTTNTPRTEEAALRAATALGIPTLAMIDLFEDGGWPMHGRDHRPDAVCVLADSVRQTLLDKGFAPGSVHVTGNPAFDGLFDPAVRAAGQAWRAARGWQGLRVLFYAAGPDARDPGGDPRRVATEITADLRAHVEARPDTALVVRYHPGDWALYPTGAPHPRIHFSPPPQEALHPILHAADAVVIQTSTVGLEAAILGLPVITTLYAPGLAGTGGMTAQGVSVGCPSRQALPGLVDAALAGTLPQTRARFHGDGHAAERVAALIRARVGTVA